MNEHGTRYISTTVFIDVETGEIIRRAYVIKYYHVIKKKKEITYNKNKTIAHVKYTGLCRKRQQLEFEF